MTKALIVVDIQNDYFKAGKWPLVGMEEAAVNAALVLEWARENKLLVVHVRHEFPTADAPFFSPGSEGAQIHSSVAAKDGEHVVVKHQINSFRDTDLKAHLDKHNIKEVIVIGAMSHMCVDAVTRAANDFGYKVTVVHDACASRDVEFNGVVVPGAQAHAAYMSALGFAYATMQATKELVGAKALTA
jgi:nicotinamidase-related amidase